jgi:hypothetical protein
VLLVKVDAKVLKKLHTAAPFPEKRVKRALELAYFYNYSSLFKKKVVILQPDLQTIFR